MNTGKVVIILIVTVALAMSGFACWYHFQDGKKSLALWGVESANLIRHAKTVQRLTLVPADENSAEADTSGIETINVAGQKLVVKEVKDISQNRGLVHARHTLVEDSNFDWDAPIPTISSQWAFAIRFIEGDAQATVAFDLNASAATLVGADKVVSMPEAIKRLHGWIYREEQAESVAEDKANKERP